MPRSRPFGCFYHWAFLIGQFFNELFFVDSPALLGNSGECVRCVLQDVVVWPQGLLAATIIRPMFYINFALVCFLLLDGLRRCGDSTLADPYLDTAGWLPPKHNWVCYDFDMTWATLVKGLNGQSSQSTSTPFQRTTTASTGTQMPL